MESANNPRVFISYAHESPEHRAAVGTLADWLIEQDVAAVTDQPHENHAPETGWQMWMQHNVEDADVVLVICTPRLKARFEMRDVPDVGLGATFEGTLVTQLIYDAAQRNEKFVPVLPDDGHRDNIPLALRRFDTGLRFPSGRERILRRIREEVQLPKPSRPFQMELPGQLQGPTDNRLAPQEGRVYGRDSEIQQVLDFLRGSDDSAIVCAHVTGTGGIGKTEVCKAALKSWLAEQPEQLAFYVDLPDTAGADELVYRIAAALGAENVASFADLRPLLRDGLYYLDNLESVVETSEGRNVLALLRGHPGVRVLASSRVGLPGELGKPIVIDTLPHDAAVRLFRELWAGEEPLEDAEPLRRFVEESLGNHALSITLTARLGDSYPFSRLVEKWTEKGTSFAADAYRSDTRRGSLTVSLALTAESLRAIPGALLLWTLAALFPTGIDEESLAAFEKSASLPDNIRQRLSRHHVWTLRDDRFRILPPVARFALDEAAVEHGGFSWDAARPHAFGYFLPIATIANGIASTNEVLSARARLLARFDALARMLEFECGLSAPRRDLLHQTNWYLINVYMHRAARSRELLRVLVRQLPEAANAVCRLGEIEGRMGDTDEAQRLFERALVLCEREGNRSGRASVLGRLADLEENRGRFDLARSFLQEALQLHESEQEEVGQANTLKSLGDVEHRADRSELARDYYLRAADLYRRTQNALGLGNVLLVSGNLELRWNRLEEAQRLFAEALESFELEQDGLGKANTLKSMADLERNAGRYPESRRLYEMAAEEFRAEHAATGLAHTFKSSGDLERLAGNTDEARRRYEEAIKRYRQMKYALDLINALKSFGDLELGLGDVTAALNNYEEALAISDEVGALKGVAYMALDIARCHHAMDDSAARDDALVMAVSAASTSGIGFVMAHVGKVIAELMGSQDAQNAWFAAHFEFDDADPSGG